MASINLPRRRGWGNLSGSCEAPLACLRHMPWTSPIVPHPVQHEVNDTSRFLVRPRLLTRFSAVLMVRNGPQQNPPLSVVVMIPE
jgi:hypothetical protein